MTFANLQRLALRGACLLGLGLLAPMLQAQNSSIPADQQAVIEIVRLQHRDPELIRNAISPLLDDRGAISQIDHNLIISTSRANLTELEALIDQLDVPLKQLLIRVDFNYAAANVQTADDGSQLNTISTQRQDYPVQNMRVTEGEYTYFNRYQDSPQISPVFGPYGLQLQQDMQRSEQSIAVKAQLWGDQAVLEFAASMIQAGSSVDAEQGQSLRSSLRVGLNQWIPLQQAVDSSNRIDNLGPFTATTTLEGGLAIRIEVMP
tara:strand:- start:86922 stop:87707 length:786 start_codon:yes stop_codon:yes gene_type:complete